MRDFVESFRQIANNEFSTDVHSEFKQKLQNFTIGGRSRVRTPALSAKENPCENGEFLHIFVGVLLDGFSCILGKVGFYFFTLGRV